MTDIDAAGPLNLVSPSDRALAIFAAFDAMDVSASEGIAPVSALAARVDGYRQQALARALAYRGRALGLGLPRLGPVDRELTLGEQPG
jgi:hypothetical protein